MTGEQLPEDVQARIDWAESVQVREADTLSVELASTVKAATARGQVHLDEIKSKLLKLGISAEELDKNFSNLVSEKLHELDEPFVRNVVEPLVEKILMAAADLGRPIQTPVTVSSLPTGMVNAMAANDPGDGSLHLFVDTELLTFCNQIGKIFACCVPNFPLQDRSVPRRSLGRALFDPQILNRLFDLMLAVTFSGRARAAEP